MFSNLMLAIKTIKKIFEYKKKIDNIKYNKSSYFIKPLLTLVLSINTFLMIFCIRKAVSSCCIKKPNKKQK